MVPGLSLSCATMSSIVAFFDPFQFIFMKKSIPALCVLLWLTLPAPAQDRLTGKTFATRAVVMAQHGMACTSHPLSTQAAIAVLRSGGNAIDAAIAANAMEGLVEPDMNGIGGDLFAIVWEAKTKKLYGLNGSGRSPYSLTLAEFQKARANAYSERRTPAGVYAGLRGWLVYAAQTVWQKAHDRNFEPRHPVRPRGISGA